MVNNKLSVDAYPSEYVNFLLLGSLRSTTIPVPTLQRARFVVQRLNQLKSAMKREMHPQYQSVAKTSVLARSELGPDSKPTGRGLLIAQPRDLDILSSFHDAGVRPSELSIDPLANFDPDKLAAVEEGEAK